MDNFLAHRSLWQTYSIASVLELRRERLPDAIKIVVVGFLNLQPSFLTGAFVLASDTINLVLQLAAQASSTTTSSSMTTTQNLLQLTTANSNTTTLATPTSTTSDYYDPNLQMFFAQLIFITGVVLVTDAIVQGGLKTAFALVRNAYRKASGYEEIDRQAFLQREPVLSRSASRQNIRSNKAVDWTYGNPNNYACSIFGIFSVESIIDTDVKFKEVAWAALYKANRLIFATFLTVLLNEYFTMDVLNRQDESDQHVIGDTSFFGNDALFNWITLNLMIVLLEALLVPLSYINKLTGCCSNRKTDMGEGSTRGSSGTIAYGTQNSMLPNIPASSVVPHDTSSITDIPETSSQTTSINNF